MRRNTLLALASWLMLLALFITTATASLHSHVLGMLTSTSWLLLFGLSFTLRFASFQRASVAGSWSIRGGPAATPAAATTAARPLHRHPQAEKGCTGLFIGNTEVKI
uniref:Uncharacterized protein n=1 Tax=Aegilops tauschii TaxID=37682 RepID=M8CWP5_AEGTA